VQWWPHTQLHGLWFSFQFLLTSPFSFPRWLFLGQVQWLKTIIPATWEVEIGRIEVQAQPQAKSSQDHTSVIPNVQEPIGRKIAIWGLPQAKTESLGPRVGLQW
jgi:hypothetical protein